MSPALMFAAALVAQTGCTASSKDPWLTPGGYAVKADNNVPLWLVYRVRDEARDDAVRRLVSRSAAPLSRRDVVRFAGTRLLAETRRPDGTPFVADWFKGRRPYLVRSVFPVSDPRIAVEWFGTRLVVRANGMGCVPFRGEPLLVWLDRAPSDVVTWATADL